MSRSLDRILANLDLITLSFVISVVIKDPTGVLHARLFKHIVHPHRKKAV